ncbi:rhamnose transport system permease protein [Kineococcus xinjiangensis]|uniref:Autoinducer 2 import system permease protein LsrC n=1 Tax=Kineococcus xinjiangensis TaxID=512762 RepID=A0A2S6IUU6_9ACTN|nr:ABC transporter permease [Kineococcus xinjiangensis]PPK98006.1 rhamnose transport system permease protein [Kineococcus xinjiangensis]
MSAATAQRTQETPVPPAPPTSAVERVLKARSLGIVLALVVLVAVTAAANPLFVSGQSLRDIALSTAILAILAVGQTIVIITRSIDLSVGSVLGLSAYAAGSLLQAAPGTPIVVAIGLAMLVGAACGLVNAVLVRFGGVPALVVTLGTLYIYRGIAFFWAGGQQINADEMPGNYLGFGTATVLGVPVLVLIAAVVLVVAGIVLGRYRAGRDLYAIGSNPDAAVLAGISVGRRLLAAFVVSGALAGLAGALYAARFGTVDAAAGTGYELNVVAAAVVGGVVVTGGSGTVWGAALGALLLTVINSALPVLRIDQFWQQAIVGALILLAISTDRVLTTRLAAQLRRRNSHGR